MYTPHNHASLGIKPTSYFKNWEIKRDPKFLPNKFITINFVSRNVTIMYNPSRFIMPCDVI
jgi:hypothetical protein